jgi:hypothetical protein
VLARVELQHRLEHIQAVPDRYPVVVVLHDVGMSELPLKPARNAACREVVVSVEQSFPWEQTIAACNPRVIGKNDLLYNPGPSKRGPGKQIPHFKPNSTIGGCVLDGSNMLPTHPRFVPIRIDGTGGCVKPLST